MAFWVPAGLCWVIMKTVIVYTYDWVFLRIGWSVTIVRRTPAACRGFALPWGQSPPVSLSALKRNNNCTRQNFRVVVSLHHA